ELQDPVLIALAGYERAHAATGCGTYARGRTLAERAIGALEEHLSGTDALPMYGQLMLTCGFAALGAGGSLDESLGRLDEAARIAERTGETDTLGLFFGPTNVRFWRLSMETDGGEPGRGVEIAGHT